MHLLHKPDAAEALKRWAAFWQAELIDRPPVLAIVPRENQPAVEPPRQLAGTDGDYAGAVQAFDAWAASMDFLGESFPMMMPTWGPDTFAGFLGCDLEVSPGSQDTSWSRPCVEEWEQALPLRIAPDNPYWQGMLEFYACAGRAARGKFLVSTPDLHSNVGALAAMRGFERFCLDLLDRPETIDRAVAEVQQFYEPVYNGLYAAAAMDEVGWTCSAPGSVMYPGRGAVLQCDFSALMSPAMFRRWVMPCLEAESSVLDYAYYHLDGPGALQHLPDLLALERVHVVGYHPGARLKSQGVPDLCLDVQQRIQAAGKAIQVGGPVERLKWLHRQIRPELVLYIVETQDRAEVEAFQNWLTRNC